LPWLPKLCFSVKPADCFIHAFFQDCFVFLFLFISFDVDWNIEAFGPVGFCLMNITNLLKDWDSVMSLSVMETKIFEIWQKVAADKDIENVRKDCDADGDLAYKQYIDNFGILQLLMHKTRKYSAYFLVSQSYSAADIVLIMMYIVLTSEQLLPQLFKWFLATETITNASWIYHHQPGPRVTMVLQRECDFCASSLNLGGREGFHCLQLCSCFLVLSMLTVRGECFDDRYINVNSFQVLCFIQELWHKGGRRRGEIPLRSKLQEHIKMQEVRKFDLKKTEG